MNISIIDIEKNVDTSILLDKPLSDWRELLADECQVYVCGDNYIGKRFDQINYQFCNKDAAKEILIDNIYALLRFKYFPKTSEEIDEKIAAIVKNFTANLKSTLKKVSFNSFDDCQHVKMIPYSCVAFKNGVYDFKENKFLFKYDIIELKRLHNKIYMYSPEYVIFWYLNINFEPLPFDIQTTSLEEFVALMKDAINSNSIENYCFKLVYNMSHESNDDYSANKLLHLSEVMGYTMLQQFNNSFVMLIGSGQNGKNSLIDGCFGAYLSPKPANNSLDDIEQDNFITGALENRFHNFFLETKPKTTEDSTTLKALTGSQFQTIHHKGVDKYSGMLNVKYLFSANDQSKVKFSDTSIGFTRRINILEIWYTWDPQGRYLKKGDYYETSFSEDLHEITDDVSNAIMYVYFAMYGIKECTNNFTRNFKFTLNNWKNIYSDIDNDLKDSLDKLTINQILSYINVDTSNYDECKTLFYSTDKERLYTSTVMNDLGYKTYEDMLAMLDDDTARTNFFAENDVYISVRLLQKIVGNFKSTTSFTQGLKKIYMIKTMPALYNNKPYVKCRFVGKTLKFIVE